MDDDTSCKTTSCCMQDGSWEIKSIIEGVDVIQRHVDSIKDLIKDDPQNCLKDFNILARVRYYYSMIENIAGGCNNKSKYLEEDCIRYELWNKDKTDD